MKRKIKSLLLLFIFLVSLSPLISYSHPGRTDKNGGHWDRKNGTYHYHTGEGSGRSGNSYSDPTYSPFTPPYTPEPRSSSTNQSPDLMPILLVLLPVGIAFYLLFSHRQAIYDKISPKLPTHKLSCYQSAIQTVQKCREETKAWYEKAQRCHSKITIPPEFEIGKDNLPKEKNIYGWGKTFTIYLSPYGRKFHRTYGCCNATIERHIYYLQQYRKINAEAFCKLCGQGYPIPSLDWYNEYLAYQKCIKAYQTAQRRDEFYTELMKFWHQVCNRKKMRRKNKLILEKLNDEYQILVQAQTETFN